MDKSKKKYYYRTEVYFCVICGVENVNKFRTYNKKSQGVHLFEDACHIHF